MTIRENELLRQALVLAAIKQVEPLIDYEKFAVWVVPIENEDEQQLALGDPDCFKPSAVQSLSIFVGDTCAFMIANEHDADAEIDRIIEENREAMAA
jgi:hypothetical protein